MQSDLFGNVPSIVIDVHETGGKGMNAVKHLISILEKENINYTIQKIPIGDILGPNGIAIERKTVNDLVNTLKGSSSGVPRLTKQLDALTDYEKPYLLVENILSIRRDPMKGCIYVPFSTKKTKNRPYFVTMERVSFIHPNAFDALIESIEERGITVLKGFNALHSAGILFGILSEENALKGKKEQRLPIIRTRKKAGDHNDEQEFFIAGLPQVNVVRAKIILEKYGSPYNALLHIDEWAEIPGIGPKTISAAKKVLYSNYSAQREDSEEQTKETKNHS